MQTKYLVKSAEFFKKSVPRDYTQEYFNTKFISAKHKQYLFSNLKHKNYLIFPSINNYKGLRAISTTIIGTSGNSRSQLGYYLAGLLLLFFEYIYIQKKVRRWSYFFTYAFFPYFSIKKK